MELIDDALGASDPTSFRNIGPSMDKARQNMITTFNKSLRHEGNYTGPDVEFPDTATADTPADTPVQERVKSILEFNPRRPTRAESDEMGGAALPGLERPLPTSYTQTLDTMIATAENPDATSEQRAQANAFLDSVQKHAQFHGVREYVDTRRGEFGKIQRKIGRKLRGGE